MYGLVPVLGVETVAVHILWHTAVAGSFLMQDLLPLSQQTVTGSCVLVRGIEMRFIEVPLQLVHLKSDHVSGDGMWEFSPLGLSLVAIWLVGMCGV